MAGQNRLVKKVMSDDAFYDSVPCSNRFAPLSQVKDEGYDTLDNTLLHKSSLDTSTFAALGTGGGGGKTREVHLLQLTKMTNLTLCWSKRK